MMRSDCKTDKYISYIALCFMYVDYDQAIFGT